MDLRWRLVNDRLVVEASAVTTTTSVTAALSHRGQRHEARSHVMRCHPAAIQTYLSLYSTLLFSHYIYTTNILYLSTMQEEEEEELKKKEEKKWCETLWCQGALRCQLAAMMMSRMGDRLALSLSTRLVARVSLCNLHRSLLSALPKIPSWPLALYSYTSRQTSSRSSK